MPDPTPPAGETPVTPGAAETASPVVDAPTPDPVQGTPAASPPAAQTPPPTSQQPQGGPSSTSARRPSAPALVVLYGDPKTGKSTDLVFSFQRGLFLADLGALTPAQSVVEYLPPEENVMRVRTLEEAEEAVKKRCSKPNHGFDAIIFDDTSLCVARTKDKVSDANNKDPRRWSPELKRKVIAFVDVCRDRGCHVIFNCHITHPFTDEETKIMTKGGPQMPGSLASEFPKFVDMLLRVTEAPGRMPWPYEYSAGPRGDNRYTTGDRHNVIKNTAPMNIAEILRAAGFTIGRHPALGDIEAYITWAANNILLPGASQSMVLTNMAKGMQQAGYPLAAIRWAARDARDRAEIMTKINSSKGSLLDFGISL